MHDLQKKVGLGTVQFGMVYGISNKTGQTPAKQASKIISLFEKFGGTVIDTASAYGESEKVLGMVGISNFRVVTKYLPPEEIDIPIAAQLKKSLDHLEVSSVYGYLAHRPDSLLQNPEQWEQLKELKDQGIIMKIGVSLGSVAQWDSLLQVGIKPDLIQVPFNYFDRRFEPVMKQCKEMGTEVHVRSAFLQGLFFRKPETLSDFFNEVKPLIGKLQKNNPDLSAQLLSFALNCDVVDYVITGVETDEQLEHNMTNLHYETELPDLDQMISEKILNPANWPQNQ